MGQSVDICMLTSGASKVPTGANGPLLTLLKGVLYENPWIERRKIRCGEV